MFTDNKSYLPIPNQIEKEFTKLDIYMSIHAYTYKWLLKSSWPDQDGNDLKP